MFNMFRKRVDSDSTSGPSVPVKTKAKTDTDLMNTVEHPVDDAVLEQNVQETAAMTEHSLHSAETLAQEEAKPIAASKNAQATGLGEDMSSKENAVAESEPEAASKVEGTVGFPEATLSTQAPEPASVTGPIPAPARKVVRNFYRKGVEEDIEAWLNPPEVLRKWCVGRLH